MSTIQIEFALCLDNRDHPASLEARQIYETLPTTPAEARYLRVIDESGEDYPYSPRLFLTLELPEEAECLLASGGVVVPV